MELALSWRAGLLASCTSRVRTQSAQRQPSSALRGSWHIPKHRHSRVTAVPLATGNRLLATASFGDQMLHACVRRDSLGSERAAVESLRSEVAQAQQAVRSEQLLAERLRKEAAAASASAQRQACFTATSLCQSFVRALVSHVPPVVRGLEQLHCCMLCNSEGLMLLFCCRMLHPSRVCCLPGLTYRCACAAGFGEGGEGGSRARAAAHRARACGGAIAHPGAAASRTRAFSGVAFQFQISGVAFH